MKSIAIAGTILLSIFISNRALAEASENPALCAALGQAASNSISGKKRFISPMPADPNTILVITVPSNIAMNLGEDILEEVASSPDLKCNYPVQIRGNTFTMTSAQWDGFQLNVKLEQPEF